MKFRGIAALLQLFSKSSKPLSRPAAGAAPAAGVKGFLDVLKSLAVRPAQAAPVTRKPVHESQTTPACNVVAWAPPLVRPMPEVHSKKLDFTAPVTAEIPAGRRQPMVFASVEPARKPEPEARQAAKGKQPAAAKVVDFSQPSVQSARERAFRPVESTSAMPQPATPVPTFSPRPVERAAQQVEKFWQEKIRLPQVAKAEATRAVPSGKLPEEPISNDMKPVRKGTRELPQPSRPVEIDPSRESAARLGGKAQDTAKGVTLTDAPVRSIWGMKLDAPQPAAPMAQASREPVREQIVASREAPRESAREMMEPDSPPRRQAQATKPRAEAPLPKVVERAAAAVHVAPAPAARVETRMAAAPAAATAPATPDPQRPTQAEQPVAARMAEERPVREPASREAAAKSVKTEEPTAMRPAAEPTRPLESHLPAEPGMLPARTKFTAEQIRELQAAVNRAIVSARGSEGLAGEARFEWHHEELGLIRFRIATRAEEVSIDISSGRTDTVEALAEHRIALERVIADAGLRVERLDVRVSAEGEPSDLLREPRDRAPREGDPEAQYDPSGLTDGSEPDAPPEAPATRRSLAEHEWLA